PKAPAATAGPQSPSRPTSSPTTRCCAHPMGTHDTSAAPAADPPDPEAKRTPRPKGRGVLSRLRCAGQLGSASVVREAVGRRLLKPVLGEAQNGHEASGGRRREQTDIGQVRQRRGGHQTRQVDADGGLEEGANGTDERVLHWVAPFPRWSPVPE